VVGHATPVGQDPPNQLPDHHSPDENHSKPKGPPVTPKLGTAHVIRGNALALPLEDESVDLVVTSPPYFGLRSYQDGGTHYDGQIGAEPTPAEFVDALIAATREMIRVLKPTGSIWVNLGDKYATAGTRQGNRDNTEGLSVRETAKHYMGRPDGFRDKSLIGIPWRYALRAIDDLGLILRAEIIWSKPNGLPESVTDRVRRSHEVWFHFTKEPRYYSAVDEIREEHVSTGGNGGGVSRMARAMADGQPRHTTLSTTEGHPLGKLPGSVWEIPTSPLTVPDHLGIDHYAAFPLEWPRRIIAGWSPPGICTACGQGRRPVAQGGGLTDEGKALLARRGTHADQTYMANSGRNDVGWGLSHNISGAEKARHTAPTTITGYACACPDTTAPTTPSVILDPFGGTGTTALAAKAAGRTGITIDMSADYCRLAEWRTTDPGQLASAMQVDKPTPVAPDQLDLLEGLLG
jgi:DNA modification methylase